VLPMSGQLDHAGPLTKTVRDAAIMLEAIEGYDAADANSVRVGHVDYTTAFEGDLDGVVVGVPRDYFWDLLEDDVRSAVETALGTFRELGAEVRDVELASFQPVFAQAFDMVRTEAIEFHSPRLAADPEGFSPELRAILQNPIAGTDYVAAQRVVAGYRAAVRTALKGVTVLIAPTTRAPATPIGQQSATIAGVELPIALVMAGLTAAFNVAQTPALSLPCGFSASGLPIGMQIVGRPFDEWSVFRAAHAYEQATDWHERRPPLG